MRVRVCICERTSGLALRALVNVNNHGEINTPFDHFHSDLIWKRAGEMIKTHFNGIYQRRVVNMRPTAAFQMHLVAFLCIQRARFVPSALSINNTI